MITKGRAEVAAVEMAGWWLQDVFQQQLDLMWVEVSVYLQRLTESQDSNQLKEGFHIKVQSTPISTKLPPMGHIYQQSLDLLPIPLPIVFRCSKSNALKTNT
jgi:hypothetical protein